MRRKLRTSRVEINKQKIHNLLKYLEVVIEKTNNTNITYIRIQDKTQKKNNIKKETNAVTVHYKNKTCITEKPEKETQKCHSRRSADSNRVKRSN